VGSVARAHLAYGYDLGSGEDFRAAERDEYGGPVLSWMPDPEVEEPVDGEEFDFVDLALAELRRTLGSELAVGFEYAGWHDNPGWVLAIEASMRTVAWSETMALELAELTAVRPNWDIALTEALRVLGITPTQDGPKWLVFPSYG
jgi:hypothetical protein